MVNSCSKKRQIFLKTSQTLPYLPALIVKLSVMFQIVNDVTLSLKYDVYNFKMLTPLKGGPLITRMKHKIYKLRGIKNGSCIFLEKSINHLILRFYV